METPLDEKICNELIDLSPKFLEYFVLKEYLIVSDEFMMQSFYEIGSKTSYFLHLTGLNTYLSPNDFLASVLWELFQRRIYLLFLVLQKDTQELQLNIR